MPSSSSLMRSATRGNVPPSVSASSGCGSPLAPPALSPRLWIIATNDLPFSLLPVPPAPASPPLFTVPPSTPILPTSPGSKFPSKPLPIRPFLHLRHPISPSKPSRIRPATAPTTPPASAPLFECGGVMLRLGTEGEDETGRTRVEVDVRV
jgi:hypothetical protein